MGPSSPSIQRRCAARIGSTTWTRRSRTSSPRAVAPPTRLPRPPRDVDPRSLVSAAATAELYDVRPFFDLVAGAGYTWGTVNPRLGEGPTANGSLLAIGIPRHVGRWANLALVARGQVSYSSLVT